MKARELFEMGAAPVAPPKPGVNPGVKPGVRPGTTPAPSKFPSPSRRKFPGERPMPKPKACDTATKYESRATLIVKRLLA